MTVVYDFFLLFFKCSGANFKRCVSLPPFRSTVVVGAKSRVALKQAASRTEAEGPQQNLRRLSSGAQRPSVTGEQAGHAWPLSRLSWTVMS